MRLTACPLFAHALLAAAFSLCLPADAAAEIHKFKPTAGVQTFAVRPPVLSVQPGDTVETETFSRPGDYYDPKTAGPWPGEVGPFHIEGAAPGDTLVVRILKLTPNRDVAISNVTPNGISARRRRQPHADAERSAARRGASSGSSIATRMVGILDLPNSASKRIELPLRPMLGRVAVAPAGEEAWGGLWPGDFGGNLDASDVGAGRDRFTCPSSIQARCSTSATSTRCRATARSPARASSRPPTSRFSSM